MRFNGLPCFVQENDIDGEFVKLQYLHFKFILTSCERLLSIEYVGMAYEDIVVNYKLKYLSLSFLLSMATIIKQDVVTICHTLPIALIKTLPGA